MIATEEPKATPVEGPGGTQETKLTHPAFGQVSASRVNGRTNLYGSDFSHNSYISLEIKRSEIF